MADVINFKNKDDYSTITKILDGGEKAEFVDIDSLTEDQFKKFCRDSGTEYFKRFGIGI